MERLRLVENPVDRLARTIEALLVIASKPLSVAELAAATEEEEERVETALGLIASRFREGRSGIVLEHVAGGYAYRAAREAAEACGRLVERPVQRGLSQAALETLSIVAYLGPVSRPEIARIRGVAADSAVAGLVERGLIAEAGREGEGGAVRYETTPLFERLDDPLGLFARERAEGLRCHLAVLGDLDEDLVRGLVVGRLEDLDDVVAPERHVGVDEPAAAGLDRPLGLLDPVAPGRNAGHPLRGELHQGDVDRHRGIMTACVFAWEDRADESGLFMRSEMQRYVDKYWRET